MRIATVSDLHVDYPENRDAVVKLAGEIHRRGAELLIIDGDLSHRNDRIERALLALKECAPRIAYVPGNHELWSSAAERERGDAWHRYRVELRAIAEAAGAHYLPAAPLVIGSIAVAGTCGWYDYSLVEPWVAEQLGSAAFAAKRFGPIAWSDGNRVAFRDPGGAPMGDPEVAAIMEAELALQLEDLERRPEIEQVVAVTHVQPFREVVFRTGTLPWEYFCAFMGSAGLGERIQRAKKVRVAVYGHSHKIGEQQIAGLRVYGTALGYPRERIGLSMEETIATRIGWIEI